MGLKQTIFLYGEHHSAGIAPSPAALPKDRRFFVVLDPRHRTTVWHLQTFVLRFDDEG